MAKKLKVTSAALENAIAVESGKISTGATLLLAAAAASNPLAVPIGSVAAVGYSAAVIIDWFLTGRFCPLPVCRTTIGDMFTIFGAIQGGEVSPEAEHLLEGSNWLSTYESRPGLEVRPALMPGAMQQILDECDDEPIVAIPRALPQPAPKQTQKPKKAPASTKNEDLEDLWAEDTVNDISKAFASADQRNRWEKNIREMDEAEERKRQEAIAKAFPEPVAMKALEMEHQYAVAVQEEAEEIATASRATTAKERLLSSPYTSRFFCGAQRTGKSYLAATAAQEMGCNIYHMNLASNLGNAGDTEDERYWKGAKRSLCCDLSKADMEEAAQKISEAIDVFNAFDDDSQPALLIVDEWTGIGSLFHRHAALLSELMVLLASRAQSLATSGKKQKKAIWAIAPQFVAGNLSQPAKVAKSLNLCYVTVPPARAVTWDTESIRFSSETFDQIKKNFPIEHPGSMWRCDRIAWVDDRWLPVGQL